MNEEVERRVLAWLAEHGDAVMASIGEIDGWLDYLMAAADDDASVAVGDREVLRLHHLEALRALLAALTTEEPA